MSWAAFIGSGVGIWAKKGAAALGMGFVTFVAFNTVKAQINSVIATGFSSIPGELYQIIALFGFVDAVGIWLGALSAAAAWAAVGRISTLTG